RPAGRQRLPHVPVRRGPGRAELARRRRRAAGAGPGATRLPGLRTGRSRHGCLERPCSGAAAMSGRYGRALTVGATVGSGLAAGVFFAFSTFVMTALGRLPDREGLMAMQEINDAAPTPWFTLAWIGPAGPSI